MEVILKQDVDKLGHQGDVVKVAEGYGRNYLLPKKLAIEATAGNKAVIGQMKAASLRRVAREKSDAESLAKQFEGVTVTFTRRSGENNQLFGSVTTSDIAQELESKGFTVDRRKLALNEPIKTTGDFKVGLKLHRDVTVEIPVHVGKEQEVAAE
ncbi:MAG TPA: 50S ribosomal protein L9 [Candidatus Koribacter sp.]|jgi:large subunit ribosomal protein L9